jgi:hypothetical protein
MKKKTAAKRRAAQPGKKNSAKKKIKKTAKKKVAKEVSKKRKLRLADIKDIFVAGYNSLSGTNVAMLATSTCNTSCYGVTCGYDAYTACFW